MLYALLKKYPVIYGQAMFLFAVQIVNQIFSLHISFGSRAPLALHNQLTNSATFELMINKPVEQFT